MIPTPRERLTAVMLAALLAAAACSRTAKEEAPPPSPALAAAAPKPPRPSFAGSFQEKTALGLVFKDVANPRWKAGAPDVLVFDKGAIEHYAKSVGRFPFHQDGIERLLFVHETAAVEDNTCHACGVTLGAAVFAHRADTWHLEFAQPDISGYGSFGTGPQVGNLALLRIGRDRFALRVTSCDMHFGRRDCMLALHEAAAEFPQVFLLVQASNNEGTCSEDPVEWHDGVEPCVTSEGTLTMVPGGNLEYDDIVVATRGTEMDAAAKQVVPFARESRFTFRAGRFEKQPG